MDDLKLLCFRSLCCNQVYFCFRYLVPQVFIEFCRASLDQSRIAIEKPDFELATVKELGPCIEMSCHVLHIDSRCFAEAQLQVYQSLFKWLLAQLKKSYL